MTVSCREGINPTTYSDGSDNYFTIIGSDVTCPAIIPPVEKDGCTYTPVYNNDSCITGYNEDCSSVNIEIIDGDLIRNPNAEGIAQFDIYIVQLINNKKFKRLILSPKVFLSYGHLDPNNVIEVDQATMDSYVTSDLVRAVDDPKVYKLYPSGDTGEKRWIKTGEKFNTLGYDWDAIYTINQVDRDEYITGTSME